MRSFLQTPRYTLPGLLGAAILAGIIVAVLVLTHGGHHQHTYWIHQ